MLKDKIKEIEKEFDEEFNEDIFVSAHSDWLPKSVKQFYRQKIDQIIQAVEENKKVEIKEYKSGRISFNGLFYLPENKAEQQVLNEIRKYFEPGGIIKTCCIDNPLIEQVKDWHERLK